MKHKTVLFIMGIFLNAIISTQTIEYDKLGRAFKSSIKMV